MANQQKEIKPVDRALAAVNQQIETLERQLREADSHSGANPLPVNRVASFKGFIKDLLTPPAPVQHRLQRGVPDVETNPMHDLESDPIPFARRNEPDLFTRQTATAGAPDDTLGRYLAAGSTRPPKPTLKRVQRETRNRFYMWLGLALVALWLIIVVVR
ncbi:MAG: hypothetical protein WCS70_05900 [Verrucomicrobiota bacterium]